MITPGSGGERFLTANIDRAIVMTQYDLRGFAHPIGCRYEFMESPKSLFATTVNIVAFAARATEDPPDTDYVSSRDSTFEEYLEVCQRLAADCDLSEKEAITLIVQEIVRQSGVMKSEVAEKKREPSSYLMPLDKSNWWGRTVLALVEAFEIKLEPIAA